MDKVYTGAGDRGYTETLGQKHISKADILIELLGSLDELSASIGVAKSHTFDKMLKSDIDAIQKKLVGVMAEVAGGKTSVTPDCPKAVESMISKYGDKFEGFKNTDENPVSANLSLARAVCRRAERQAVKLNQQGRVKPLILSWLNRISDLLYAMSQYASRDFTKKTESGAYELGKMNLSLAKELSLAVEKYAETMGVKPVIAISDAGANLVLLHATDDSYIASRKIATDKAYTAVSLKMPTAVALKESRGGALDGLVAGEGLCLLGGGEPLISGGKVIGGIGVSGGTSEQDTNLAAFAAEYYKRRQAL